MKVRRSPHGEAPPGKKAWWAGLPAQVVLAMILGVAVGILFPTFAKNMKVLGDIFLDLLKMGIAPLVFFTIVQGIAKAGDLKQASRIGLFALIYFEVISTVGLGIGLGFANIFPIGQHANGLADSVPTSDVPEADGPHGFSDFVASIVPDSFVGAFTTGQLLSVVIVAVFFGIAVLTLPTKTQTTLNSGIDTISGVFFALINVIMRLAPIGAFGSLAYAIGASGTDLLVSLAALVGQYWLLSAVFFILIFGGVLAIAGVSLWKIVRYLRLEIGLTLSTGSSEAALPGILEKLPRLGVDKQVVGLVVPTGFAFNLDGTSLYMSVCTLFLAHAYGVPMGLTDQLALVAIMMVTSKGAATVNGGTFVVFAATVTATGMLPTSGLPILFGIYQFMSRATATVNTFGNVVATVAVARATGQIDRQQMNAGLNAKPHVEAARSTGSTTAEVRHDSTE
jgi:aerobic C4-dicarboxylate transport protein